MSGRNTRRSAAAAASRQLIAALDPREFAFSNEAVSARNVEENEITTPIPAAASVALEDFSNAGSPIRKISRRSGQTQACLKNDLPNSPACSNSSSSNIIKCSICLEDPPQNELAKVDKCAHLYCFSCIEKWSERENSCPLCKTRFTRIERVHKTRAKRKVASGNNPNSPKKNSKRVKKRDQKADLPFGGGGNVLELFLSNLERREFPNAISHFLFSAMNNSPSTMASRHGAPRYMPDSSHTDVHETIPTMVLGNMMGNMITSTTTTTTSSYHTAFSPQILRRSSRLGLNNGINNNTNNPRSYAINSAVANAGMSGDVPLEIEDDSSDEEIVEVTAPPRPAQSRRRR